MDTVPAPRFSVHKVIVGTERRELFTGSTADKDHEGRRCRKNIPDPRSKAGFSTEEKFVQEFCRLIWNRKKIDEGISEQLLSTFEKWKDEKEPIVRLGELFDELFRKS